MATIDQQFVEYIVKTLVNNPDKVIVDRQIDEKGVLLTNATDCDQTIKTNLTENFEAFLIDENHLMTKAKINPATFVLKANQIILLRQK